jgi:GNAT superfamily N-acetyltransferase
MSLDTPWPEPPRPSSGGAHSLPDGGCVFLRRFQSEDRAEVAALFERLSPASVYYRFHLGGIPITESILDLVTAGHALVAEADGRIAALASCHPLAYGEQAELGIVVDDLSQRRGIGTILCHALCHEAQRAGICWLRAEVLGSNHAMLRLLRSMGFPTTYATSHGVVEVAVDLLQSAA